MTKRRTGRKRKAQPVTLPPAKTGSALWDAGSSGYAAERRKVKEPLKDENGKNPNNVERARIETLAQAYAKQGILTAEQAAAADIIRYMAMQTQKGPAAIKPVQVDTFGVSDGGASRSLRAMSNFRCVQGFIPRCAQGVVLAVSLDDEPIEAPRVGYGEAVEKYARLAFGLQTAAEAMNDG